MGIEGTEVSIIKNTGNVIDIIDRIYVEINNGMIPEYSIEYKQIRAIFAENYADKVIVG